MMKSILLALFAGIAAVTALPSGAPICTINEAAPGPPHRGSGFRQGFLEDGAFIVTVDGTTLNNSTILEIQAGVHDVVFTSETGSQPYRGVLGIIHSPTYNFTFRNLYSLSSDLQNSTYCADIKGLSGVTHVINSAKTSVTAKLFIPDNIEVVNLDANIVVANNQDQGSVFYYTQYKLKVTGATSAPTPAPTVRPCGLFGLRIFCPFTFCGFFGRLLFGSTNC